MKSQVAYATLVDQIRALRFFEKFVGIPILLSKIRPRDDEAFIAHRLASGVTVATANKDIRALKRIFNLAIDPRGYLAEVQNPFGRIKQRKKAEKSIRYVSVKEHRSLMEATESRWWQAVISLAYSSGLRKGEILNLTWMDIDFEKQQIYIRAKWSTQHTIEWEPKDHENRVVPMSDETTQLLVDVQVGSKEGFPYVFISPERFKRIRQRMKEHRWNAGSETVSNIGKNCNAIRCKVGIAKCTLHDLRRSAITNRSQRLPIQVVQQFAGHSNIATTRTYYLAVRPEDFVSANRIINEILGEVNAD